MTTFGIPAKRMEPRFPEERWKEEEIMSGKRTLQWVMLVSYMEPKRGIVFSTSWRAVRCSIVRAWAHPFLQAHEEAFPLDDLACSP